MKGQTRRDAHGDPQGVGDHENEAPDKANGGAEDPPPSPDVRCVVMTLDETAAKRVAGSRVPAVVSVCMVQPDFAKGRLLCKRWRSSWSCGK